LVAVYNILKRHYFTSEKCIKSPSLIYKPLLESALTDVTFSLGIKIGSNVRPPKDVEEKEQFKQLHQWIQGALWTTDRVTQV